MYVIYSEETCIFWSRNGQMFWHWRKGPAAIFDTGVVAFYEENQLKGTYNVRDLQ